MLAEARFCRRCGQPAQSLDQASVTEANTRVFEQAPERGAQTQYHDPRATGPSYLAPNADAYSPPAVVMNPEPARLKRHGILWGSAIVVVILLLLAIVFAVMRTSTTPAPTTVTKPEVPVPPVIAPPQPPQPPQPPAAEQGKAAGLVYPGAEITMEMTRGAEGSVRQLRTGDSFDKVVAWYTNKLKPTNTIKASGSVVLTNSNTTAVITSDGDETTVLLKEGIDQ